MDWINRVYRIQVDITSHCNARCPGCVRSYTKDDAGDFRAIDKKKETLPLSHFDFDKWVELCTSDDGFKMFPNLNQLVLNGSWGDPCMHPRLPEMLAIFCREFPEAAVNMHTNGGAQRPEWWGDLGKSLAPHPHSVIVALDGLEDTHALYRRGTDYNRILENVKHFVDAGGSPRWMMTVFNHNKHQVEEARELATKYEFRRFVARRSHTPHMVVQDPLGEYTISNDEVTAESYMNEEAHGRNRRVPYVHIPSRPELEDVDSQCEWYKDGAIQIDPWGYVWPCCHTAPTAVAYGATNLTSSDHDEINFIDTNPDILNHIRLDTKTLKEIITGDWYTRILEDQVESASLTICKKSCGVKNKNGTL